MAIVEGVYQDAPEALGEMFISSVRNRNASLMNNLLRRPFLWGRYNEQFTREERQWCIENIEKEVSKYDD